MASSPSDDALYGSEKDATPPVSETPEGASPSLDESPIYETPEEREARMSEMTDELEKVEGEITMLRQVLGSKVRHATELKRKLGITPFQEFKQDFQTGIQQIKSTDSYQKTNDTLTNFNEKISSSQAYKKTSAVVKTAGEKTSSALSSVGQVMVKKMGDIKNSQTYKSFDEKVHTTYASVKAKVTASRSSSEIDEAFRDSHDNLETEATTSALEGSDSSPALPEEKIPL